MTMDEALARATISVPDAGTLFFGLSKNGAYEAARRGDIPTLKIGRKIVVPVATVAEMVGLKARVGSAA